MSVNYSGYEQQRRNIETDWAAKTAANDFGRFVAQQRGSRQVGDMTRQFGQGWGKQASSWGARGQTGGRVNSGFYQKAMQNYLGDYQRGRNDLNQNLANEQTQFGLNQTGLEVEKQRALADLELQKQREIAMLAQNIQAIKPLI